MTQGIEIHRAASQDSPLDRADRRAPQMERRPGGGMYGDGVPARRQHRVVPQARQPMLDAVVGADQPDRGDGIAEHDVVPVHLVSRPDRQVGLRRRERPRDEEWAEPWELELGTTLERVVEVAQKLALDQPVRPPSGGPLRGLAVAQLPPLRLLELHRPLDEGLDGRAAPSRCASLTPAAWAWARRPASAPALCGAGSRSSSAKTRCAPSTSQRAASITLKSRTGGRRSPSAVWWRRAGHRPFHSGASLTSDVVSTTPAVHRATSATGQVRRRFSLAMPRISTEAGDPARTGRDGADRTSTRPAAVRPDLLGSAVGAERRGLTVRGHDHREFPSHPRSEGRPAAPRGRGGEATTDRAANGGLRSAAIVGPRRGRSAQGPAWGSG